MSVSQDGGGRSGPADTVDGGRSRGWWVKVAVASLVAPVVMNVVAAVLLLLATRSFDPAHVLGVSDAAVGGIFVVIGGLLAGAVVGLIAGIRGWRLTVPILAAVIVGLVIYLGLVALGVWDDDGPVWLVWLGQSAGIFAAISLTGFAAAGAAAVVALAGIGFGLVLQGGTEPPADLAFVLAEQYVVDDATGECSGSDDFAGIVERSRASWFGTPEVEDLEPIVLPSGREITRNADSEYLLWNGANAGCLFVLSGTDLGASAFTDTYLFPEFLGIGAEQRTSGQRVVFLFGENVQNVD